MLVISNFTGIGNNDSKYVGEILFSTVIISTDSIRVLLQFNRKNIQILREILFAISFFTIFFAASLYGVLMSGITTSLADIHTMPLTFLVCSIGNGLAVNLVSGDDLNA